MKENMFFEFGRQPLPRYVSSVRDFQTYTNGKKPINAVFNYVVSKGYYTSFAGVTISSIQLIRPADNRSRCIETSPSSFIRVPHRCSQGGNSRYHPSCEIVYVRMKFFKDGKYRFHVSLMVIEKTGPIRHGTFVNPSGHESSSQPTLMEISILKRWYNLSGIRMLEGPSINTDHPDYKKIDQWSHVGWCKYVVFFMIVQILVTNEKISDIYRNCINLYVSDIKAYYILLSDSIAWLINDYHDTGIR